MEGESFSSGMSMDVSSVGASELDNDDWILHTTSDGQQHATYDSSVKTVAEAETKGYKNVTNVFANGTGRVQATSEVINFKADGKFSVNGGESMDVDDTSYTTKGGSLISENKGTLDAFGDFLPNGMQDVGDSLTLAALPVSATGFGAPLGALMAEGGGILSAGGTGLGLVNDAFEGDFSIGKAIFKGAIQALSTKFGGDKAFGPTEKIFNDNLFNLFDKTVSGDFNKQKK